uniref:Uncharacterized protein n=1 Tax=Rhizophagus irregularis (strain DAOM 181602 / DAOM 197198 / MUCL 43194) TaxID=747089 RepID=U9SKA1_RHIID
MGTRRIWNVNSIGIWKMVYNLVKDNNLIIVMNKVKVHSDDTGNNIADSLSKQGLNEKDDDYRVYINIDSETSWEYMVYWKGNITRKFKKFMKKYNQVKLISFIPKVNSVPNGFLCLKLKIYRKMNNLHMKTKKLLNRGDRNYI